MKIPDETKEKILKVAKTCPPNLISIASIWFMLDQNYLTRMKLKAMLNSYEAMYNKYDYYRDVTQEQIRWLDLEESLDI